MEICKEYTPALLNRMLPGAELKETLTKGLFAFAAKDGSITWRYDRRTKTSAGGERIKRAFGIYPANNIVEARTWAGEINRTIERGENPNTIRAEVAVETVKIEAANAVETARLAMTVRKAWESYIGELEDEGHHSAHTIRMKRCRFDNDILPAIGAKPLTDVEHDDLWSIVTAKKRAGFPSASNHLVVDIKVFFKWCMTHGREETGLRRNPSVDIIKLAKEKARARTFKMMELRLFVRALAATEEEFTRKMFTMLALTGQRTDNVLNARPLEWSDELQAWEIERTKNDDPNVVPLGAWGKSLFQTDKAWVFPSVRQGKARKGNIAPRYRAIREKMQAMAPEGFVVEPWSSHDLRRVIKSHMSRLKVKREISEMVLGHAIGGVEGIYDRYEYMEEKREALAKWEAELIRIAIEEGVADRLGIPSATITPIALAA